MDSYYDSKEFRLLKRRYEESQDGDQKVFFDCGELTDLADYYLWHGEGARGEAIVAEAMQMFPGARGPLLLKARQALACHDAAGAALWLEQVEDEEDAECWCLRAEIMMATGEWERARELLLEKLELLDEEDERADYIIEVAMLFADYDKSEEAAAWLQRCQRKEGPEFEEVLGRIAMGRGAYEEAEKIFERLIDEDPFEGNYWNALAWLQLMRNDVRNGIKSSEYAIALNPYDAEAMLNKANGLLALTNYEEAYKYYKRYGELQPHDELGEMYAGICELNMDNPGAALRHLERAVAIAAKTSPHLSQLYEELAFANAYVGDVERALYYIGLTDELDCDHEEMMVIRGHVLLGANRSEEAAGCYKQAIRASGLSPHIVIRVAISLFDCRYVGLAYEILKKVMRRVNESWKEGFSHLAACAFEMGERDEFLKYLQIACERNPDELRGVMSEMFPKGMDAEDFYAYAYAHPEDF